MEIKLVYLRKVYKDDNTLAIASNVFGSSVQAIVYVGEVSKYYGPNHLTTHNLIMKIINARLQRKLCGNCRDVAKSFEEGM